LAKILSILLVPLVLATCWRVDVGLAGRRKLVLFVLLVLVACGLEDLHHTQVDEGHYFALTQYADNTQWQRTMHRSVIALSPDALPHSYRFLPDGLIAFLEWPTGSFEWARALYRLTFVFMLVLAIYYLASLYLPPSPAMVVVFIYAFVYPFSIRYYAGQPTDPASHLSFILAFIFLELGWFLPLAVILVAGILAKESVAVVALYYALFEAHGRRGWLRAGVLVTSVLGVALLLRLGIRRGDFGYREVSGVSLGHVVVNLSLTDKWPRQLLFTVGALLPFAVLGWQRAPERVRNLTLVIGPALIVTNVFFSWMHEARNFIPLTVLLTIIGVRWMSAAYPGTERALALPR
jgi:hypothetical protein